MLNGLEGIDLTAPDALDKINALAKGLSDKNADLLGKISSGKEQSTASAAELENLRLFKQGADQKILEEGQQYEQAKASLLESHAAEMLKANERGKSAEAQLKTLLIDNGLSAALDGVNINKNLKAGAVAMLQANAVITDGQAMIGDKSLSDAVSEWAATETGKAFCLAENNSGGNGNGGTNTPTGKPLTLTDKAILANQNK
tara:strand:- start:55 stop:660 length:606 start_codon:yes stop_codon:yes gene_type:complete